MPKKKTKSTSLALAPSDALATVQLDMLTVLTAVAERPIADLGDLRELARLKRKELDTARAAEKKSHLDAGRAAGRAVDAKYRAGLETCQAVVDACTERLEQYLVEQRRIQLQLVQDTVMPMAEKHQALIAVSNPVLPTQVRVRVEFGFEVESFEDVPRDFLVADVSRIMQHIKDTQGTQAIAGIRITRKEKVTTK